MNKQETDEAGLFTSRLPQTHARGVADRIAMGKALRQQTPRNLQATWKPPTNRTDPVELLVESSQGRMEDLLPIRYGRMMASPFAFYRGAAAIMASDLAHTPATGLNVQACGDCHLLNFGGFATSERKADLRYQRFRRDLRRAVGMGCQAPGRQLRDRRTRQRLCCSGLPPGGLDRGAELPEQMAAYAEMPVLDVWYDAIDLEEILDNAADKETQPLLHEEAGGGHRTERPREGVRQAGIRSRRPAAHHRPAPADLPYRRPARCGIPQADRRNHGQLSRVCCLPINTC